MDRHLKERLVGAAVLVAAAVILIPEMLSEPKDGTAGTTVSASGETDGNGVKTYTIDLAAPNNKSAQNSDAPAPAFQETAPAPPPETPVEKSPDTTAATPPPQSAPRDRDQKLLQEFTEQGKAAENKSGKSAEKTPAEKQPEEKLPVKETPAAKIEPQKNFAPVGAGAWAVQVASFGVRATSEKMASDLKAKGYPAFVTSFATTGQTMYRVRVGPVEDRASAETLLKKIKSLHPGAAVVPQ